MEIENKIMKGEKLANNNLKYTHYKRKENRAID